LPVQDKKNYREPFGLKIIFDVHFHAVIHFVAITSKAMGLHIWCKQ
jgi:hypothetical protein